MKLWELNTEFDIEINYPYIYNYPMLSISEKGGRLIGTYSLMSQSINEILNGIHKSYPNSIFLNRLLNEIKAL